ncbi:DUF3267 domain-containing protein [uncultured Clostridium sp.]|uniref:DUF3267 domain-containing protein n=1 Tax=uncultured Clostridium sp. TaxID=59620 RepID=UPI0025CD2D41|nr:DUF3267 domain-containing protein [uncultured Clostridium sp.]
MKLSWKGKFKSENLLKSDIPKNAAYFYDIKFIWESYIAIVPILLLGVFLLFIKSKFITHGLIFTYLGRTLEIILGFSSIIIHEFLHAIAYPSEAEVEMFYSYAGLGVMSTYPVPKWRYIFIGFFPSFVLGVIPFILWLFIPLTHPTLNTIVFIFAWCSLGMSTADYDTIFHALKEVPEGAVIQGDGTDAYWYIPN